MSDRDSLPSCTCPGTPHEHGTAEMYEIHGCGCVPCTAANNVLFRQRREGPLPVCDCPRAAHIHGTRIMYNRHLCPCTPCATANLEYTRAYNERVSASALPVCECPKASHVHGTRDMYGYHRCRCVPCSDANRDYSRRSSALKPKREMADANLARARIDTLRGAGMTMAEIAALCGVNAKVIQFALYGHKGRKPERITASTLRALEAISYRDAAAVKKSPGRKVDGDIPRRQVQALHSLGWSGSVIASRAGAEHSNISWLLSGRGTSEEVRAAIDRVYEELRRTLAPETTPSERSRASRARNRAAANGWTADMAEDHLYAAYARAA
jgi:transcriptional regulator with XRE-family HTH domain